MRLSRHLALVTAALLPVLGAAPPASAAPDHRRDHGPAQALVHKGSVNWSGYETLGKRDEFSVVEADWTVPFVTCTRGSSTESAVWVGLDGVGDDNPTVEQTGVTADCSDSGRPVYRAWYEMYPDEHVFYNDPVRPGDAMHAQVRFIGGGRGFELVLRDRTRKWLEPTYASPPFGMTALRSTAEVIVELPSEAKRLTDFGTVLFKDSKVNEKPIGDFRAVKVTMFNPSTQDPRAVPSELSPDGKTFSVTWKSY